MNWKVKEVAAGTFKAKCLQLMDEVNEEGIELVITKRGKPVAKLVPIPEQKPKSSFGCMKGSVSIAPGYDIVASDPTDWDDGEDILGW